MQVQSLTTPLLLLLLLLHMMCDPFFETQVLSAEVASYLGLEQGKIKIKRFADGEIYVQVQVRQGAGGGERGWHTFAAQLLAS
jgi:hypothetical protein